MQLIKYNPLLFRQRMNRNKQSGFNLVELIVVMAIIGILATIAIPGILHWLPNIRLKAAARDLYSNMQETKIKAIKQNHDWAIVFDSANDRYYICSDPGVDDDWTTVFGVNGNTIEKTVDLSSYRSGVSFGHGNSTSPQGGSYGGGDGDDISYTNNDVIFNPRGTGETGYVYLENGRQTDSLTVGTFTSGLILILRWTGSNWE